jgi:class 3 adenylate cyclase
VWVTRVWNTAEDTVARLNALFENVVPAVVDAGGHVNKFLGDGALEVSGVLRRADPSRPWISSMIRTASWQFPHAGVFHVRFQVGGRRLRGACTMGC